MNLFTICLVRGCVSASRISDAMKAGREVLGEPLFLALF